MLIGTWMKSNWVIQRSDSCRGSRCLVAVDDFDSDSMRYLLFVVVVVVIRDIWRAMSNARLTEPDATPVPEAYLMEGEWVRDWREEKGPLRWTWRCRRDLDRWPSRYRPRQMGWWTLSWSWTTESTRQGLEYMRLLINWTHTYAHSHRVCHTNVTRLWHSLGNLLRSWSLL